MRIVILSPPGVQSLDIVGPAEVFWEAARRLGDMDAYDIQIMSTGAPSVSGTGQLRFLADRTIFDPDEPIDTLLVAGDPSFQTIDPDVIAWLQRRVPMVRRFGSICTGVFLLAAAGLLEGKKVTTHWECADKFARDFPAIDLDPDAIYIRDGALITAAGVTSGIDLALSLVEEDHGRDIAMIVARYMVMFMKRPGGQSQFSAHLVGQMSETTLIQKAQEYVLANLGAPLAVDDLAQKIGMSKRNFARVFRRELGITPADFVTAARTDAARRLLEDTAQPLQKIATMCGFTDVNKMRRAFTRTIGVSPNDYRCRFQRPTPTSFERSKHSAYETRPASRSELQL
ncbi:transcriptional regulator containing an amidase domain and an AraC-type DNA-binding HTH domain [Rhizobium leguminosarum bv. trifolii WSM597]|uniref:Transcriptional regulator containing an amidase domain and an AraC-type DNA-binding HTH domain n=1 Tax=Rhizobium leguminosarum bv. trifolii WSM597 TaxID=754764 RepID=J0H8M9_RHILT|nr:GlxA family transcriptional regulator [Rhizobium leguminosarum]EJB06750.1 transcriptional regulator containing an amidase domain and an AraC-type DNA-binding HTH domain [Rhizobium leguminosarum bv. trifolii WSM597]